MLLRERESTGRIALKGFWVRRARRLLPALAAVVLAVALGAVVAGEAIAARTLVAGVAIIAGTVLIIFQPKPVSSRQ